MTILDAGLRSGSIPLAEASVQDQRSFRDTMGRFPTGVVLVTAMTENGPVGMAVNSFTSVSLDPPIVSFCPMVTSESWGRMRDIGSFAITILRSSHEDVSRLFATKGVDRFSRHEWTLSPGGHPILEESLAWIDASISHVQRAGDHELVLATADRWSRTEIGEPLVFFGGRYSRLAV